MDLQERNDRHQREKVGFLRQYAKNGMLRASPAEGATSSLRKRRSKHGCIIQCSRSSYYDSGKASRACARGLGEPEIDHPRVKVGVYTKVFRLAVPMYYTSMVQMLRDRSAR